LKNENLSTGTIANLCGSVFSTVGNAVQKNNGVKMIVSSSSELTLSSAFINNSAKHIIYSTGARSLITIDSSCFLRNKLSGGGSVYVDGSGSVSNSNSFGRKNKDSSTLSCSSIWTSSSNCVDWTDGPGGKFPSYCDSSWVFN